MLSILIPVYNINSFPLAESLTKQLKGLNIKYEIICIDDASTNLFLENDRINNLYNASFIKLKKNIGRSKIRNLLANQAKYPWLLFLDADTLPVNSRFINNYMSIINDNPQNDVYNGGLSYREKDKTETNHLRFKYGVSRESLSAKIRNKKKYSSLLMSNTLIRKNVFDTVQFNENIIYYGHEDSLFSADLKEHQIKIKHIDNPVFHIGIENNSIFINKSKIAIQNLWALYQSEMLSPTINKLLRWSLKLKKNHLHSLFSFFFIKFGSIIEKKLTKQNPSLMLFDFYRLCYLSFIIKNPKQINALGL